MEKFNGAFLLMATSTLLLSNSEKIVQAFSEGTDCRCKCILSAEDGGPCDESLTTGARKAIYTVETISTGKDCKCSCNTPSAAGCRMVISNTATIKEQSNTRTGDEFHRSAAEARETRIDLIELHSSISDVVSAMIKLERAILKTSSNELHVMRNNVEKVVLDLSTSDACYTDLIADLTVDKDQIEKEELGASKVSDSPLEMPTKNPTQRPKLEEITKNIEVPREYPTDETSSNFLRRLTQKFRSDCSGLCGVEKAHTNEASSVIGIADQMRDDMNIIGTSVQSKVTPDSDIYPIYSDSTINNKKEPAGDKNTNFDIAESPESGMMTLDLATEKVIEPEIISFVPYQIESADSESPPDTSDSRASKNRDNNDYLYDDDDFDLESEHYGTSVTEKTIPEDAFEPPKTISGKLDGTKDEVPTSEDDYLYSDYLEEYGNGNQSLDEYYEDAPTSTTGGADFKMMTSDKCGTLYNISRAHVVSHFGRREGAWMKDPVPSTSDADSQMRIYIANSYYGSNLLEFDNVEGVRDLRWRNSYNLPHKWIGTGHIVYNGSFYYNRAFSTSLIKYDLQFRFMSAWIQLTNAIYDSTASFTWRGHSMVHMAADGDGLWVIFPSKDPLDSDARLTYVINEINPINLKIQKSFKSTVRKSASHVFMICGVVYTTELHNARNAVVTHAFDTKTSAERFIYLSFENRYSYSVQLLYNPKERKLYAWDSGRQIEYNVGLTY